MFERELAFAITGTDKPSALMTDAYKFSMAQAGFPLRKERFVLSFRKGGPFYIPCDLSKVVKNMLPSLPTVKEAAFLTANGYGMTPAMEQALQSDVNVWCAPEGSWVYATEPILTVEGPSFLVSWLEPLLIMLNGPIQMATDLANGKYEISVTEQATDVAETVFKMLKKSKRIKIIVSSGEVILRARSTIDAVGDSDRVFEVGLRAATCFNEHMEAMKLCKAAGLTKTSNLYAAWKLYMIPVGTTGHEHQMRWMNDYDAYSAIRDCRPETPSYLFDTYNPYWGLQVALDMIAKHPDKKATLRFDSGDFEKLFEMIINSNVNKENTYIIFEDGYDFGKTVETLRMVRNSNWNQENVMFGYGGYLQLSYKTDYFRDNVSAAYKLSCTNDIPVWKFSGTPGKNSIPGNPIVFRRNLKGGKHEIGLPKSIAMSIIGQEGELPPEGFRLSTDAFCTNEVVTGNVSVKWSKRTIECCRVPDDPETKKLFEMFLRDIEYNDPNQ